jgi:cyclopropane fatty-acyl-phospholipid synthase-like methyltransferase
MMREYDKQIYEYYLGQDTNIEEFVNNIDREKYHQQLDYYWSKFLDIGLESNILDLGCGWGDFLLFLKNKGFKNLYGIDASVQQVEIANRIGLSNVECGNLFELLDKFIREEKEFSVISALNILEHLDKDTTIEFLKKINVLLSNGGKLLLEIPNANSTFGARTRYWDFTHKVSFTPTSIEQVLLISGYTSVEFQEKIAVPKNITGKIRILLWKLIKLKIYYYLLVEQGSIGINVFSQDMHVIATKKLV